jgi:hypothetical protein
MHHINGTSMKNIPQVNTLQDLYPKMDGRRKKDLSLERFDRGPQG